MGLIQEIGLEDLAQSARNNYDPVETEGSTGQVKINTKTMIDGIDARLKKKKPKPAVDLDYVKGQQKH